MKSKILLSCLAAFTLFNGCFFEEEKITPDEYFNLCKENARNSMSELKQYSPEDYCDPTSYSHNRTQIILTETDSLHLTIRLFNLKGQLLESNEIKHSFPGTVLQVHINEQHLVDKSGYYLNCLMSEQTSSSDFLFSDYHYLCGDYKDGKFIGCPSESKGVAEYNDGQVDTIVHPYYTPAVLQHKLSYSDPFSLTLLSTESQDCEEQQGLKSYSINYGQTKISTLRKFKPVFSNYLYGDNDTIFKVPSDLDFLITIPVYSFYEDDESQLKIVSEPDFVKLGDSIDQTQASQDYLNNCCCTTNQTPTTTPNVKSTEIDSIDFTSINLIENESLADSSSTQDSNIVNDSNGQLIYSPYEGFDQFENDPNVIIFDEGVDLENTIITLPIEESEDCKEIRLLDGVYSYNKNSLLISKAHDPIGQFKVVLEVINKYGYADTLTLKVNDSEYSICEHLNY